MWTGKKEGGREGESLDHTQTVKAGVGGWSNERGASPPTFRHHRETREATTSDVYLVQ